MSTDIITTSSYATNVNPDEHIRYCNICTDVIDNTNSIVLECNQNHYFCYQCIYDWYIICNKKNYDSNYRSRMCPICKKDGGYLPINDQFQLVDGIHNLPKCTFSNKYIKKCHDGIYMNELCKTHYVHTNAKCLHQVYKNGVAEDCGKKIHDQTSTKYFINKDEIYCIEHYIMHNKHKCNHEIQLDNGIIYLCTAKKYVKHGNKCNVHSTKPIVEHSTKPIAKHSIIPNGIIGENPMLCNTPLKTKKGQTCKRMKHDIYGGKCYQHKINTI